jgi:hypothetical protein
MVPAAAKVYCPRSGTAVLRPQPSPDFICGQSCNSNNFVPAGFAGRYGNGRTRHLQKICEEFDAGFIGPSVDCRCGQSQFQRVTDHPGNGVLPGAWLHFNCEAYT